MMKPPVNHGDHVRGLDNASVTLVEYGDYECPHCGAAYFEVKRLQERFDHKMKFVFRNFPLSQIHAHAVFAAAAAESAALQGKFWEMHDIIFENQQALEEDDIYAYAKSLNLDLEKFAADLDSEEIAEKVKSDFKGGVRSGVNGTPSFYINGEKFDGESLAAAIENSLVENQSLNL